MGRIFEKRKTTMFARWDRMSRAFSKIAKEITMAAKRGLPDPDANPALRRAMANARAVNMPKDKVEAAIKRAAGDDSVDYQEVVYEGYAAHGVAIIVTCATDNPTRTVANVRSCFKSHDGNMGSTGSVAFGFKHMGVFRIDSAVLAQAGVDPDDLELELIDHGLEEMLEGQGDEGQPQLVLRCPFGELGNLQRALEERQLNPAAAVTEFVAQTPTLLPEEQEKDVLALVDALEQDDDVQSVFTSLG
ncbi:MAG: YebC/PmpR family DNA-binding transcriptional regulator [Planctomycetes bacterium]|nr:YebC/PmpR family DNA-binding transcriptional regulator [Planctomycetota bacterium]